MKTLGKIFLGLVAGFTLGIVGNAIGAGVIGPMYMDATTKQAFPAQVPPTTIAYPYSTKSHYATGTNTVTQTDIATATPSPSAIPMSGTDNRLAPGWLPANNVYGAGTSGYLPRWTGTGTATLTDSTLYDDGVTMHRSVAGSSPNQFQLRSFSAAGFSPTMSLMRSRSDTLGTWSQSLTGDDSGSIYWWGGCSTAGYSCQGGRIYSTASANGGTDYVPSTMRLESYSASGPNANQLALWSDGNVTASGKIGASNTIVLPNATKTLLTTATLTVTTTDIGTASPTIGAIPIARGDATLDPGWLGGTPSAGQVLRATSTSVATWQTLTATDVGAAPAGAISGTENYLAKFAAGGASVVDSRISEDASTGKINALLNASATGASMVNLSELGTAFLGVYPGAAYDGIGTQHGIMSRSAIAGGITHGGLVWRRFGAVWETAIDFYVHPSGTGDVDEITRALSLTQAQAEFLGQVSTPSMVLRGSTSGTATIAAPAAAGTTTWTLPASMGSTGQVIGTTDGAGTLGWYTPMIADGTTGTGCTTISSTAGKVTACDTTSRVASNSAITASGATYKFTQYDSKGLTVAGLTASPANLGAVAVNSPITASGSTYKIVQYDAKGLVVAGVDATAANVDALPVTARSDATPLGPGYAAAASGTSTNVSRADHRHPDSVDISWTHGGKYNVSNFTTFGLSNNIVWEHPLLWANMPSSLAFYATYTIANRGSGDETCYVNFYTGSSTPGTLGGTGILSTSHTVSDYTVYPQGQMFSTSATFTRPSGTNHMVQLYGYCTASSTYLQAIHIHITAGS